MRIKGFDYTQPGAYFVTICTYQRACALGSIHNREIKLNDFGHVVQKEWFRTAELRQNVHLFLDEFVVMPNHLHGILFLDDSCQEPPLPPNVPPVWPPETKTPSRTIGSIVRGFKIGVTKWAKQHTSIQAIWQRDYFDRVLRDQEELVRARNYIANNPLQWAIDKDNPECRP